VPTFDPQKVRRADRDRTTDAQVLNRREVLAALFEATDISWDADDLRTRARPVRADELRAILTAIWIDQGDPDDRDEAEMRDLIDIWTQNDD